jgi:hypothetical protein
MAAATASATVIIAEYQDARRIVTKQVASHTENGRIGLPSARASRHQRSGHRRCPRSHDPVAEEDCPR